MKLYHLNTISRVSGNDFTYMYILCNANCLQNKQHWTALIQENSFFNRFSTYIKVHVDVKCKITLGPWLTSRMKTLLLFMHVPVGVITKLLPVWEIIPFRINLLNSVCWALNSFSFYFGQLRVVIVCSCELCFLFLAHGILLLLRH